MKNKESWEQCRMISYMTAQVNTSKELDPKQIMTLPWEGDVTEQLDSVSMEDMMKEMKDIENKLNNNG